VTLQLGFAIEASCVQPAWYGIKQQVLLQVLCKKPPGRGLMFQLDIPDATVCMTERTNADTNDQWIRQCMTTAASSASQGMWTKLCPLQTHHNKADRPVL